MNSRSKTIPQPHPEKTVIDLIHVLLLSNEILFQQATQSRLHGTRGRQEVFPHKLAGSDDTGFTFLSKGNQQFLLFLRDAE